MYYIMEDKDGIERLFASIYIDNIKTPYILSSNGSVYNIKSGFDFDNVCDILSMKKSKAFKELVRSRVQLLN